MKPAPGQQPGQPGVAWGDLLDALVATHGSLAAVAERLCEHRRWRDDRGSVERALRRLRVRDQLPGGVWGGRVLACFGLPLEADARLRWMGTYHSRFTDLPVSLCVDQLRLWARPPVWEAPGRAWLELGLATASLRARDVAQGHAHAASARSLAAQAGPGALLEMGLLEGYLASRTEDAPTAQRRLEALEPLLHAPGLADEDRACWRARWIDQRAWILTHAAPPALEQAAALYEQLAPEGPAFARCRRNSGLAWVRWRQGDTARAAEHARQSVQDAGDAGLLRLRAMALTLYARVTSDERERARAVRIAASLEDEDLAWRLRPRG